MDDPFGPIIISVLSTLLAAVVRLAAACLPFLDEGELRRQAEGDSPRAKRAVRLIERGEQPFGPFNMTWTALVLIAWTALHGWLRGGMSNLLLNRLGLSGRGFTAVALLIPFVVIEFMLSGVVPGYLAAHGRQKLFDTVAPAAEWTLIILSPVTRLARLLGRLILKPFHLSNPDSSELVTEEDILQMVDIGEEKGAIESDE